MRVQEPEWSPETKAIVTRLWKAGASATDISKAIGGTLTRNAVLGRIHRMGLGRNGNRPNAGRPKPVKPPPPPKPPKQPYVQPQPINEVWEMFDDDKRRMFAERASRGARKQLEAISRE